MEPALDALIGTGFVVLPVAECDKYRAWGESGRPVRQPQPLIFERTSTRPADTSEQMLTKKEVADLIKATTRHVEKMVAAGKMPRPMYIGKSVRWKKDTVQNWLAQGCPSQQEEE